jgi:hypothetical protein
LRAAVADARGDDELLDALWDLVWAGEVTNDTFAALRALSLPRSRSKSVPRPGRLLALGPPRAAGRWSLVADLVGEERSPTERGHALATALLERQGIVTREGVAAESVVGGYASVYPVLRAMEESGRIRRGYFVGGVGATQFALPAALDRLRALRIDPGTVHLANSAAIVTRPETWADMVRPGAILYGYHPGYDPAEKREEAEARLPLKPVMSLRAKIINVRNVPEGAGVGYNATFVAKRPSRIGVLAAGYGDGIHRSLGNRGNVLLRGKLLPIVGIISMDVTMIDVTDIEGVELGEVATIYGTDGAQTLPANRVARSVGTVTSDLLCAVSQRVERIYVR